MLADLNGDNRAELIVAGADGFVHAIEPNGSELPGWPVRGDVPGIVTNHLTERAYSTGEISGNEGGAILASLAVGDANGDGVPEVYAADLEGNVYGWRADGTRVFHTESDSAYSGKPLAPFVDLAPRARPSSTARSTASSAPRSLPTSTATAARRSSRPGMDRHVYAWHADGTPVAGFPVLVVDPAKVQSVDPQTDQVTFKPDSGALMHGAIVDTPAVADLDGDGKPDIVVGTNEEYAASQDGGWNVAPANTSSFTLLDQLGQAIYGVQVAPAGARVTRSRTCR